MNHLKLFLAALGRFFYELDRWRRQRQAQHQQERVNEIKRDPAIMRRRRFGDSAGRVSVSRNDAD